MKKTIVLLFVTAILCNLSLIAQQPDSTFVQSIVYAPWRNAYMQPLLENDSRDAKTKKCPFCYELSQDCDEKNFILARFAHNTVFLNPMPYSFGHLLIIPNKHVKQLDQLSVQARTELMEIITQSLHIINNIIKPEGCNVGINLERAAGASIPDHLHVQIVPRWFVDNNFMFITGNTSVIQWDMNKLYTILQEVFKKE